MCAVGTERRIPQGCRGSPKQADRGNVIAGSKSQVGRKERTPCRIGRNRYSAVPKIRSAAQCNGRQSSFELWAAICRSRAMDVIPANTAVPNHPMGRRRAKTPSTKIVGATHNQVQTNSDPIGNEVHRLELLGNGVGVRLQIKVGAESGPTNKGRCGVQLSTYKKYRQNRENAYAM